MPRPRSLLTLLALAAVAALAGPAAASAATPGAFQVAGPPPEPPVPVPPGMTEGEAEAQREAERTEAERSTRLFAATRGRAICLGYDQDEVRPPKPAGADGDDDEYGDDFQVCGPVPRDDLEAPLALRIAPLEPVDPTVDGPTAGAVRPDVAAIELEGRNGRTVRLATVAPPAAAAGTVAAELRYFIGTAPVDVRTWRLIGADGRTLYEHDEADDGGEGRVVRPAVRVASGGRGRARWWVTAEVRDVLTPLPGEPTRRVRSLCQELHRAGEGASTSCRPLTLRGPIALADAGCATGGPNLVTGLAPARAVPEGIVTTDGTKVPFRAIALPSAFGASAVRVLVAVAPHGAGIRRALDDLPLVLPTPPTAVNGCSPSTTDLLGVISTNGTSTPLGGDAVVRPAGADGPRVFVRDRDTDLCTAVERTVSDVDCWEPGTTLGEFISRPAAGGRLVAGVVDARITRVRLTLSTGATVVVPAAPDPAYTGRYAPYVAFFGAVAPAGATFTAVAPIAPHGTAVGAQQLRLLGLRAAARARGTVRIRGIRRTVAEAAWAYGQSCAFLAPAGRALPRAGDPCPFERSIDSSIGVDVPCGRGGTVVGGVVGGRAARRFAVVLRSGRRLTAPVVRLGSGRAVAYVTVPRQAAIRRLEVLGRGGRVVERIALPVPPATAHCGYGHDVYAEGARERSRG